MCVCSYILNKLCGSGKITLFLGTFNSIECGSATLTLLDSILVSYYSNNLEDIWGGQIRKINIMFEHFANWKSGKPVQT